MVGLRRAACSETVDTLSRVSPSEKFKYLNINRKYVSADGECVTSLRAEQCGFGGYFADSGESGVIYARKSGGAFFYIFEIMTILVNDKRNCEDFRGIL